MRLAPVEVRRDLGHPRAQRVVVAGDRGGRELGAQPALERVRVVADADAADAALGRGDEQPSERAGDDGERDARPRTAAAVRGGGHAEPRVRALVHATGGAVACFVECGTHFLSLLELGLETVEPALVAILPRREAEPGAER